MYKDPQTNKVFETYAQTLEVFLAINHDFKAVNYSKQQFAKKFGSSWIPEKVLENRIEHICTRWLRNHRAEAEKKAKNGTWVNQLTNTCNNFIILFFQGSDIDDITRDDVENFYHYLLALDKCSPSFRVHEFKDKLATLKGLCDALRHDDFTVDADTIEALNGLLEQTDLYLKLTSKHGCKAPSDDLKKRYDDYKKSPSEDNLFRLNRLVLEESYPQETPKSKKYSSKYITAILGVLKSLFLRYRPADIPEFPSFSIVPVREKQRLGFTREIAAVEQVPERHGYRLAILVLLRTGMRINEANALKVHNLDDGIIYVSNAISEGELKLSRKNGGEVNYTVTPELWQLLAKHIEKKDPDDFVFEINGKPIPTGRLYKVWVRACKKAKVKHISLQQASRHSTATEIYAKHKKTALKEIQEQLGHGNTTTGLKHYVVEK